jgi:hypothetical protein
MDVGFDAADFVDEDTGGVDAAAAEVMVDDGFDFLVTSSGWLFLVCQLM